MKKKSVIIKLDGKVSAADFRTVVDGFVDLMLLLTSQANADAAVEWFISDLKPGSATIETSAVFGNLEGEDTADFVVSQYEDIARSAQAGHLDRYRLPLREAVQKMTSVVNGRIPRIVMGTAEEPEIASLDKRLEDKQPDETPIRVVENPRPYARSAIKGQIVTLDDKKGTYFTLQEAYAQRHIRCYPDKEHRSKLGSYWENKTWVIVEGVYMRYGSATPTITQITDIIALPDGVRGGWRTSVGSAPRRAGAKGISSDEAVRRVRDGEA